jgi:hypothetical protein
MAAIEVRREQDEALATATGRAIVRELAVWINTGRAPEAG